MGRHKAQLLGVLTAAAAVAAELDERAAVGETNMAASRKEAPGQAAEASSHQAESSTVSC